MKQAFLTVIVLKMLSLSILFVSSADLQAQSREEDMRGGLVNDRVGNEPLQREEITGTSGGDGKEGRQDDEKRKASEHQNDPAAPNQKRQDSEAQRGSTNDNRDSATEFTD